MQVVEDSGGAIYGIAVEKGRSEPKSESLMKGKC